LVICVRAELVLARSDPDARPERMGSEAAEIGFEAGGVGEASEMADHLDAPGLTSPAMDARVDITDHYAFQKPGDSSRTILILNVNPLAPTHADEFRHDAVYETLIDTDGDASPDLAFSLSVQPQGSWQAAREGDKGGHPGGRRKRGRAHPRGVGARHAR
jgi:hypothetical protein